MWIESADIADNSFAAQLYQKKSNRCYKHEGKIKFKKTRWRTITAPKISSK